jgi:hypothetical protein
MKFSADTWEWVYKYVDLPHLNGLINQEFTSQATQEINQVLFIQFEIGLCVF